MKFEQLIYTDLDGTLLELETYNHKIVKDTVYQLNEIEKPISFCSSKTFDEQRHYQKLLGLNTHMIIENGAGIAIPKSFHPYFSELPHQVIEDFLLFSFTEGYHFILENLDRIRKKLDIELNGYHDLPKSEISNITGIPEVDIERTTNRFFSETLLAGEFEAPNFQKLSQELFKVNLQCIPGSKFYTISGISSNKGKAINWLDNHLKKINPSNFITIGIGDSYNDLSMLSVVDRPFLVQKPNNSFANINVKDLIKINKSGPYGWNEIIIQYVGFS